MEPRIRPVVATVFRPLPAYITPVTLALLMRRVRTVGLKIDALKCWVWVEVAEIRDTERHIFFTLVQHREGGTLVAQAKGIIWQVRKKALLDKFRAQADVSLHVGMKVLAEVPCKFDVRHGFALEILDLFPSHSPGTMSRRLIAIRKKLQDEGRWDLNRRLPSPECTRNVAVIAPADSAGLGDFQSSLLALTNAGAISMDVLPAVFQEYESVASICNAFTRLTDDHKIKRFDLALLLRGGESATDLNWLNSNSLGRCVTNCPMPLWTGIGHERDHTILDEVAHSVFGTPSKAAAAVVAAVLANPAPTRRSAKK